METIEKLPLDLSQLEVAIQNLKMRQFSVINGTVANSFNVYDVAIDSIVEEKNAHNVIVAIGKELKRYGNIVFTLRNRYIVNDDFSFGNWTTENQTENIEDLIIEELTKSGFINIGFNSEEIKDFLTNPFLVPIDKNEEDGNEE